MIQAFNHDAVIMYYVEKDLSDISSLGMHSDCVYSVTDGNYMEHSNSQVEILL